MKAHRVKCLRCGNGVTVVVARQKDETDGESSLTYVFAGTLTDEGAADKAAALVAEEENDARAGMMQEGEKFDDDDKLSASDIRAGWTFHVSTLMVRS